MLTSEHEGINETKVKVNDHDAHDQVVLVIKTFKCMVCISICKVPSTNLACVLCSRLEMLNSLRLFKF